MPWWLGRSLDINDGRLTIGGATVADLAREHGTPVYAYDGAEIRRRLAVLRRALAMCALSSRIYYALKANRFAPVVSVLRDDGHVGIDACSPREVQYALTAGFLPTEISVTASGLSSRDLAFFATSGCHLNLDTISAVRRYAEFDPVNPRIGLRIDSGVEIGYGVNDKTSYSCGKLGLLPEDFDEALHTASSAGLIVDTVHTHLGWGLRATDAPDVARAFQLLADLARRVPDLREINLGGGLGGRLIASDAPLDPERWGQIIADTCGSVGVTIACEPGTYLVADAGALIVEVASIWEKGGVKWAGIDANFGTNPYAAHYALPHEIISGTNALGDHDQVYSIAGNVNESGDVFAHNRPLPTLAEGELLVLYPAGAYGASMSSDHCLRGSFSEVLVR